MNTSDTNTIKQVNITINGTLNYCTMALFRENHPSLVKNGNYDSIADNYELNRLCCGTLIPLESNEEYTLLKSTCGSMGGLDWYVVMNNKKRTSCLEFDVIPLCEVHLDGNEIVLTCDPSKCGEYNWHVSEYEFMDTKTYNTYRADHCSGLANDIDTNFPKIYVRNGNRIYITEKRPVESEWTSHPILCALHYPSR